MKILHVVSEAEPFAKTGGLADIAAALPNALAALGHDIRVILPLYRCVDRARYGLRPMNINVPISSGTHTFDIALWECAAPRNGVTSFFIACDALFDRDGLYQDGAQEYPDNLTRFSVFAQAALRVLPALGWRPDLVHAHDWQAALAIAHLRLGPPARDPFFASMRTVLTIHNLAYQGLFPKHQWTRTQLPTAAFTMQGLEFYDQINCLKGGLMTAHQLTTVSPTYAQEIQTPEWGCGLEGVIHLRAGDIAGILNGIDMDTWNPQADAHLAARYTAERLAGKVVCKHALQKAMGLPERQDCLIGMVQRLTEQKGIDLFLDAAERLMALPIQLVLLGTGDARFHASLSALAKRFPGQFAIRLAFDEALAHQIEAGADAFLMPSRFEPCGLNQMYSMRYGTVPIVRRIGGLADTVVDISPATSTKRTATGFLFDEYTAAALVEAVQRAVSVFRHQALWPRLMRTGMRKDFSWDRSARAYVAVYEQALAQGRAQSAESPRKTHRRTRKIKA